MGKCCSSKGCGAQVKKATEDTSLLAANGCNKQSPEVTVPLYSGKIMQVKIYMQNMCCEMEVELVKQALDDFEGVASYKNNALGKFVSVRYYEDGTSPMLLVNRLNKFNLGASVKAATQESSDGVESLPQWFCGISGIKIWSIEAVLLAAYAFLGKPMFYAIVATGCVDLVFGVVTKVRMLGIRGLAGMHFLMLAAALGAVALGNIYEATALLLLYSTSKILQETVLAYTRRQVDRCAAGAGFPTTATLASTNESVSIETLKIGDVIVVRAGESIPTDGVVAANAGHVDESLITGESFPVKKTVDSKVLSGSILLDGALEVRVTTPPSESSASQISDMVSDAAAGKTARDTMVETFAGRYTIAILAVSGYFLASGIIMQDMQQVHAALVLLVLGCPCALVAAGPIVTTCGVTALVKKGVFVKNATVLDGLRSITRVGLDKTGTLTKGHFAVEAKWKGDKWSDALEKTIVALESRSAHPLAAAVVNSHAGCMTMAVNELGTSLDLPTVKEYTSHDGKGVSGTVDGRLCIAGSQAFVTSQLSSPVLPQTLEDFIEENNEHSLVLGAVDGEVVVCYALFDNIKPNAREVIAQLKVLGVVPAVISGDRRGAVEVIATTLGIPEFAGQLLPKEKVARVHAWQDGGHRVMMVGDGINDAPALAAADCSVAMGAGGTALASHTAAVVCADDDLQSLPLSVQFSQRCNTIVMQNLVLALAPKMFVMLLTLSGLFQPPLWAAVLADTGCLLAVILNGTRVLFF